MLFHLAQNRLRTVSVSSRYPQEEDDMYDVIFADADEYGRYDGVLISPQPQSPPSEEVVYAEEVAILGG